MEYFQKKYERLPGLDLMPSDSDDDTTWDLSQASESRSRKVQGLVRLDSVRLGQV